jgi:hypothetical protein
MVTVLPFWLNGTLKDEDIAEAGDGDIGWLETLDWGFD